ncbi:MAG: CHAT domain-containing protein, partial [Chitinophagaceae bacterium]|nr:CHAT domain-containing protein [Chitinophagaceae bacterium]
MRPLFLIHFLLLLFPALSQVSQKEEEQFLRIYEQQLTQSLKVRSMSDPEIDRYISTARGSVTTIAGFARELENIFPPASAREMAVLFYLFANDTLHRYFIVPGKLKEKSSMPMTRAAIEKLNTDVYAAMNIYGLTANRAPRERGLKPAAAVKATVSLERALEQAAKVLLPAGFDEKFKHLVVVPAFSIGAFPFQLLRPYGDSSMLVDKCSITISPSLMDLVAVRKRMLQKRFMGRYDAYELETKSAFTLDNPLFICNPKYPAGGPYAFPDLPGAVKEIKASLPYAKQYRLFQGAKARKDSVIRYIREADLVYFATHGIAAQENPLDNNFLVLSGKDPYLTARNIMQLRDSTGQQELGFPEMVILSACQTGLGKSMEAGLTAGMARAFLIAGANQVIMSLWSVDDEATAYLMSRYIYHLQQPHAFLDPRSI